VLLGTGNPNADPLRSGPAVAIVANGTAYLVDFGPGVVRRAVAAEIKGVKALAKKMRPVLLVLYHQLFFGTTESALVGEIQRLYDGPVVSGHDLDVY